MSKQPKLNTVYHNMEFPQYEFVEFPKWVKSPVTGEDVLVADEREEAVIMASKPLVREADEIARLQKVAEIKGVQFDKRWGVKRLTDAIETAGHDAALNPFE